MTETTNYQLNQWEAEDRVQRVDFNADNARIEAALSDLERRVALLDRAAPNMAYYLGQLSMQDQLSRKKYLNQRSMLSECFLYPEYMTLSGSAVFEDHVLTVRGAGNTGTCTTLSNSLGSSKWTQAKMWVHHSNANLVVKINGQEMTPTGMADYNNTASGHQSSEQEFVLNCPGASSAKITLEVATKDSRPALVYDYFVFFF